MVLPGTSNTYVPKCSLALIMVVHYMWGILVAAPLIIGVCLLCRLQMEGVSDFLDVFFLVFLSKLS